MTSALITGSNGFIGKALGEDLRARGFGVRHALRSEPVISGFNPAHSIVVGDIDADTCWQKALASIDVVIHLAARVHVTGNIAASEYAGFQKLNVDGTCNLARQAAKAGVRRFVFISSIKVNGEATLPGKPFTADDIPAPVDAYGKSKWEAERALQAIAEETGLQVVIIRPPIVYGPDVKANFRAMMDCLFWHLPLPLGAVNNRRSILALDNLIDLIAVCVEHPAAANQTFLARDAEDLTTTELLRRIALAMNVKPLLLPVPVSVMTALAGLIGKKSMAQKLCGSLQVDMKNTQKILGWIPPVSTDEALRKTVRHYLESGKRQ